MLIKLYKFNNLLFRNYYNLYLLGIINDDKVLRINTEIQNQIERALELNLDYEPRINCIGTGKKYCFFIIIILIF